MVVLAIGGVAVARAAGTKELDHTAVEKTIESQSADTSLSFVKYTGVVCNGGKNAKVVKGATFTCIADKNATITVTITSSSGKYIWSPG